MTPEELKRLEELEKRMDAAAAKFKQLARLQNTLDEILASQKELREKIDNAKYDYVQAKGNLSLRYNALSDLMKHFFSKIQKEIDFLEMPQKIREEDELANKKTEG